MVLLNISKRDHESFFSSMFDDLERTCGKELVFVFGYGDYINDEWLSESLLQLKESGDIRDMDNLIPIIVAGKHPNINYENSHSPVFSFDPKFLHIFRGATTLPPSYFTPLQPEHDGEGSLLQPIDILTPTGAIIGQVFLTPKPMIYIYMNVFEYPQMFNSGIQRIMWKSLFTYIVQSGLQHISDTVPTPTFEENFTITDLEAKCKTLNHRVISNIKSRIGDLEHAIESHKTDLTRCLRDRGNDMILLASYESNYDGIKRQIEIIKNNKSVVWVDIKDHRLHVLTEHIYIEHDGKLYDIGHIIMKIDLNGAIVVFDNITRRVRGYACANASHPHDASGGNNVMCLGEIESFIPTLIQEGELATMVELLINFAKSVNARDIAGSTITRWPIKKQA